MNADLTAETLASSLRTLEPRHSQLLTWRYVKGETVEHCASLLGVTTEAVRIHLLRALDSLDAKLSGRPLRLRPDEEEQQLAARPEGSTDGARLQRLASTIEQHAKQIDAALREALLAEEVSPDRVREDWIRRIAVLILVGLAAWFYWRNESRESPPPSPPTRQQR